MKQKVDAPRFKDYSWGTYDLEYYGGRCGYVKDDSMTGRVIVFLSGKMISTGAKSVSESIEQLHKTMNLLVIAKLVRLTQLMPKIQNIVATLDVENKIDLVNISLILPKITYEPDQFPAAILRTSEGPVCLIFSTGKIVVVGSKSEEQMWECANILKKSLHKFFIKESDKNLLV